MSVYHQILFDFDSVRSRKKVFVDSGENHKLKSNIHEFRGSFEYKCWTLSEAYEFTQINYPFLTCIFDIDTKFNIIKCDFFRYLVLYHFGGLYTDIDFLCIKPIDDFVQSILESKLKNVVNHKETPSIILTEEWCDSIQLTQSIHNGFIYSKIKKHPFWIQLIMNIYEDLIVKKTPIESESDVYVLSGPKKLCSFYLQHKNIFNGISVLPYYYCCPYIAVLQAPHDN